MATEQETFAFTILAVDFGTAHTRASLYDVVENAYRLIGHGWAPTTIQPPYHEASEGLRHALHDLQNATGRVILDDAVQLISPSTNDGRGMDIFVITSSAGATVRAVLVGLLPDVSLEVARQVVRGQYINVLDTFSLGDRRRQEQQIDAVIAAKPQIIIVVGGTEGGAFDALNTLVETVALGCHLMPPTTRARMLYVGNQALAETLSKTLQNILVFYSAPNALPEIGAPNLAPARGELTKVYEQIRVEQIGGFGGLVQMSGGRIYPTLQAEGAFGRFASRLPEWPRGVLHVNVGSAYTTTAAAFNGEAYLDVQTHLGVGIHVMSLLKEPIAEMLRWLPLIATEDDVREFIWQKSIHPHTAPAEARDLHLELALARACLRVALRQARAQWPTTLDAPSPEMLPWLSLIIGGGAAVAQAPKPGLGALVLLDALQPVGLTRLMLDPYHAAAALGALAAVNPLAVAHLYDSTAMIDLGLSVSVWGGSRINEVLGEISLAPDGEAEKTVKVKYGGIEVLPLPIGQMGKLTLKPRATANFGFGFGRNKTIPVKGGALGVIIDARGRPLVRFKTAEKRQEFGQKWLKALGAA
jgi:hypothetical protein